MKQILFIFIFAGITSLARSQVILDMENVFGVTPCNVWCWNRVATNMLYYYFGSTPSKNEIAEVARQNNSLFDFCDCTTCILNPDSCCKPIMGSVTQLLNNWGLKFFNIGLPTCSILESYFSVNKPIVYWFDGHFITAHGIDVDDVYIIDGNEQDDIILNINDIGLGRDFENAYVAKFSPDCSDINEVTYRILDSRTYYSKNTIKISGQFEGNSASVFRSDNNIIFDYKAYGPSVLGFKIETGSSLVIYTGENNCP